MGKRVASPWIKFSQEWRKKNAKMIKEKGLSVGEVSKLASKSPEWAKMKKAKHHKGGAHEDGHDDTVDANMDNADLTKNVPDEEGELTKTGGDEEGPVTLDSSSASDGETGESTSNDDMVDPSAGPMSGGRRKRGRKSKKMSKKSKSKKSKKSKKTKKSHKKSKKAKRSSKHTGKHGKSRKHRKMKGGDWFDDHCEEGCKKHKGDREKYNNCMNVCLS
tara:strand:+ start:3027 stop:3680 length:654 start_codon:yes stop_codon:yes gene_type:complete